MKKCVKCGNMGMVGFIFHPNHCMSCIIELTTKPNTKPNLKKIKKDLTLSKSFCKLPYDE